MKQALLLFFFLYASHILVAQDSLSREKVDYMPVINGTVRAKYEYQPDMDAGRFQVRNARLSVSGKVHPVVAYKAEIDLSDEGRIRMLDAYARIYPVKSLHFTLGQMRIPFTIDAHRSPHQQFFANRSFIAKQVGNVRDVGATVCYDGGEKAPLIVEAALFNGSGLTEQREWHKSMCFSGKAQFRFAEGGNLAFSAQSKKPENVRMNLLDVGAFYRFRQFHIEGEYLFKKYENNVFDNVHAFNGFALYDLHLKKVFEKMTFLLRYDWMTDHNDGYINPETDTYVIDDYERQRITGGITFSITKPFTADLRLNYENYFYKASAIPNESEMDKIVVEVMVRF